ncbi:MAG: class I SAM-dependent DNA methyltransferase, partial [Anaerolineales bacterium]|nr:class I SAM-dependent DNA methyltransferase [Anaerolineales bacterium]
MNPQEFVSKWRGVELKERSFYQEHFLDICSLVGHATPAAFDPKGERFTFEAGAGRGFADVWKRGFFAWEYKGDRRDLEKAYDQLLRYREALENPPLLIVADTHLIRIHTNFTNTVKREYEIALDDLLKPDKLELLRCAFCEPQRLKAPETPEQVTEQAAKEFGRLAEILRKWGEDPAHSAHFLIRLLFCLFAEDIGLLPKDLFTRLVAQTRRNSKAFSAQLRQLFAAMATGSWFGIDEIAHFDGGLFDDDFVLEMESDGIEILSAVSGLDWSSIEPSILGTLFERSLDPGKRAQLGAHYTSREDILLIVEPVLMAPLRRRWEEVQKEARDLASKRDEATRRSDRTKLENEISRLLEAFAGEIRAVRVLDPACGSGNFLYVALRQLLELWREVSNLAGELGLPLMLPTSAPSPEQLYGIEVNEYAHELAQATIWIGYIQWLRENGFGRPPEPILKKLDNIKRMDAILAYDEDGRPVEPEWPEAEVVIGNPPFLGGSKLRRELGNDYVNDLWRLYNGRVDKTADLVTYWFERSWQNICDG